MKGIITLRVVTWATLGFFAFFPLFWMLTSATHGTRALFGAAPPWLPDPTALPALIVEVFSATPMATWLGNSTFIAVGTSAASLLLAIPAAYALSRHKFSGRRLFGFALFSTQMLPEALLVIPLYAAFLGLGLLNSLHGLVLANVAFAMPVAVWILKGAIDDIPHELEEQARLDGCNSLSILLHVVLPMIKPALAAAAIITFFDGWNEFLFANTFIIDDHLWPTTKGLASFIGEFVTPLNLVMGAALMFALPAIIFFLVLQRSIISGAASGSVKG